MNEAADQGQIVQVSRLAEQVASLRHWCEHENVNQISSQMELIAALIIFSCSGFGTQTDVYNHGTRETTASEIANKRITVEKITDSVFIDGNAYEAVIENGDVRVDFEEDHGVTRDFDLYIRLADGYFEWNDSLPLWNDPNKRRRLNNVTGKCKVEEVKNKS